MRPRLLDLFCGAGGCSVGYHRAGFDVVGVDLAAQPNYPFEFHRQDALRVLSGEKDYPEGGGMVDPDIMDVWYEEWNRLRVDRFDAVHASPPCQGYANVTLWRGDHDAHPRLIERTRELLQATGLPYVIENVRTTALRPCLVLCGSMFDLPIRRHRGFETNWGAFQLVPPCRHAPTDMAFMHKHERAYADAMGCDWMTAREAREAIPPAYCEFIGAALLNVVRERQAA